MLFFYVPLVEVQYGRLELTKGHQVRDITKCHVTRTGNMATAREIRTPCQDISGRVLK